RLVDGGVDLAEAMACQLVTPLDFEAGLRRLVAEGHRRFLECGAGAIVTRIAGAVLKHEKQEHRAWASFPTPDDIDGQLRKIALEVSGEAPAARAAEPVPASAPAPPPPLPAPPLTPTPEPSPFEPVAIVGMGCVLPAANGPDKLDR